MISDDLEGMAVFAAVAESKSLREAGERLHASVVAGRERTRRRARR